MMIEGNFILILIGFNLFLCSYQLIRNLCPSKPGIDQILYDMDTFLTEKIKVNVSKNTIMVNMCLTLRFYGLGIRFTVDSKDLET